MKFSHFHLSFKDYASAVLWFEQVLQIKPIVKAENMAIFKFGDLDLVMHPDWGDGDTAMTLAFASSDCYFDYRRVVQNGAKPRTPPRDKGDSIGADVFGPGKLVVEFEQIKS